MSFNVKEAAEQLLRIADALEKEAAESSYYVCSECNHTANLATINNKRAKIASESGYSVSEKVSIHDKIACPACQAAMSYVPTEDSEKYYIEVDAADEMGLGNPQEPIPAETDNGPDATMAPMKKKPVLPPQEGEGEPVAPEGDLGPEEDAPVPTDGEPAPEGDSAPAPAPAPEGQPAPDGEPAPDEEGGEPESVFEPVDEQQKEIEEEKDIEEGGPADAPEAPPEVPQDMNQPPTDKAPERTPPEGETPEGETPDPEEPKFTEMPEDIKELTEEQKKKGPGRPKQASERFWNSVAKYASN